MKFFLYVVAIAMCEAARIPRQLEYEHFPNFRTTYHGHGATSYQNVHVNNDYGGVSHSSNYADEAFNDFGLTVNHDTNVVSILEPANELGHVDDQSNAEVSTFNGFLPSYHSLETEDRPYLNEHYKNQFDHHLGSHI